MPLSLLFAYLAMLPRLQAETTLSAVEAAQLGGSATIELDAVKARLRDLERRAGIKEAKGKRASAADMAFAGMAIVPVGPDGLPLEDGNAVAEKAMSDG